MHRESPTPFRCSCCCGTRVWSSVTRCIYTCFRGRFQNTIGWLTFFSNWLLSVPFSYTFYHFSLQSSSLLAHEISVKNFIEALQTCFFLTRREKSSEMKNLALSPASRNNPVNPARCELTKRDRRRIWFFSYTPLSGCGYAIVIVLFRSAIVRWHLALFLRRQYRTPFVSLFVRMKYIKKSATCRAEGFLVRLWISTLD